MGLYLRIHPGDPSGTPPTWLETDLQTGRLWDAAGMRLTWTIALTTGPAVGEAESESLDECLSQLETALREALPDWTPEHQTALSRVRHALAGGAGSVTAPSFLVTLED